ncbi:MAG: hypothetical protein K6T83_04710, partial [Alicyclobacillus sp.]|nr:hypothetical protein [Alicyclobacillus sp.]
PAAVLSEGRRVPGSATRSSRDEPPAEETPVALVMEALIRTAAGRRFIEAEGEERLSAVAGAVVDLAGRLANTAEEWFQVEINPLVWTCGRVVPLDVFVVGR